MTEREAETKKVREREREKVKMGRMAKEYKYEVFERKGINKKERYDYRAE